MQARLERAGARLRCRACWPGGCSGPRELEARNANLVGGAINGGTAQLHQQLVLPAGPRAGAAPRPAVPGLYLGSASAHPGGGVHGAAGMNAARAALLHDRSRRFTGRR